MEAGAALSRVLDKSDRSHRALSFDGSGGLTDQQVEYPPQTEAVSGTRCEELDQSGMPHSSQASGQNSCY